MTMTPAIKGLLTKARKTSSPIHAIRAVFARHMPKQQAKHAARKYLAALGQ